MPDKFVKDKPDMTRQGFYIAIPRYFRLFVSTRAKLYAVYARVRKLPFRLTKETQVVVDSYPRSANSFFEAAFTKAHEGRIEVAHHSHAAAQVLSGAARGLPCIILLREPEAAIASLYEMHGGQYPIWLCTQEYVTFYSALVPALDKLMIITTETLETRFYRLMITLRDRWDLPVKPYEIDAAMRSELYKMVDKTGKARNAGASERYSERLNSEEKAQRRADLHAIRRMVIDPDNALSLGKARELYERFKLNAL